MVRLIVYLVLVLVVSSVAAFLAEVPGQVSIRWLGQRIDTSVAALVLLAALIAAAVAGLEWALMRLAGALGLAKDRRIQRRKIQGYKTLNKALAALASGEEGEAKRLTGRAAALLPDEPLSHVMAAEAARLAGDDALRREHLKRLSDRDETAFLGLRGQVEAARRQGRTGEMLALLDRALTVRPNSRWARLQRLETLKLAGRWAEARDAVDPTVKAGAMTAQEAKRMRAVLSHCMAVEAEAIGDMESARRLAHKAHAALPDFIPAAVLEARLAARNGEKGKAHRVLKQTFVKRPHPDLAEAEAAVFKADQPATRLSRLKALMPRGDSPAEAHLLLGQWAAAAGQTVEAHKQLDPLAERHNDSRVMAALAQTAEAENGADDPQTEKWRGLAQAAPAASGYWQCERCSATRQSWAPLCRTCQAFDSHRWIGLGETPVQPKVSDSDAPEAALLEGA
mgnify:CR=1 FL=1